MTRVHVLYRIELWPFKLPEIFMLCYDLSYVCRALDIHKTAVYYRFYWYFQVYCSNKHFHVLCLFLLILLITKETLVKEIIELEFRLKYNQPSTGICLFIGSIWISFYVMLIIVLHMSVGDKNTIYYYFWCEYYKLWFEVNDRQWILTV